MNRWLFIGAAGLPFVVLAVLVACYAVNVPVMDQWELVALFEKHHLTSVSFADFFAQHNEHRLFFPRLVMFGLAEISRWNVMWEMAASLALAAVTFWLLCKVLAKTITNQQWRQIATVLISIVFFSPMAWENWLWGWQVQWYLNVLGLVLAIWALSTWQAVPYKRVLLAAAGAVLATYSLASGFFVWLVCLPLFWYVKPLRAWAWVWGGCALAAVAGHYVGYQDPVNSPSRTLFLHQPVAYVKYIVIYLAHPLAFASQLVIIIAPLYAVAFGSVLLQLYRHARQTLTTSLLPWLILGVYACLAAASTGVTRLGISVGQAYSSRYTTLSLLLLITFIVLLCKVLESLSGKKSPTLNGRTKKAAVSILAAVGVLVVLGYGSGALDMHRHSAYLHKLQHCARTASSVHDPCLTTLYPSPGSVWPRLLYLRSIHWGGL